MDLLLTPLQTGEKINDLPFTLPQTKELLIYFRLCFRHIKGSNNLPVTLLQKCNFLPLTLLQTRINDLFLTSLQRCNKINDLPLTPPETCKRINNLPLTLPLTCKSYMETLGLKKKI